MPAEIQSKASFSTLTSFVHSKYVRISPITNTSQSILNLGSLSSGYLILIPFSVNTVNGRIILKTLAMNREWKLASLMNDRTSKVFLDAGWLCAAATLSESIMTPLIPIISSNYFSSSLWNSHFSGFKCRPTLDNASRTLLSWDRYSSREFKQISKSSRQAVMYLSMNTTRIVLIIFWKNTGVFINQNVITRDSSSLSLVRKTVFTRLLMQYAINCTYCSYLTWFTI